MADLRGDLMLGEVCFCCANLELLVFQIPQKMKESVELSDMEYYSSSSNKICKSETL